MFDRHSINHQSLLTVGPNLCFDYKMDKDLNFKASIGNLTHNNHFYSFNFITNKYWNFDLVGPM